ncbi:sugar ABC transporter substrate-binding protein [Endozoicomonadaceae bacterium StTr2]
MKRLLLGIAASMAISMSAYAETKIAVSMSYFDDNFLTMLRQSMAKSAAEKPDVSIQFEDAQGDIGRQLNQVQNFVAQDVDAIIINATDTAATARMTKLAKKAGIPLVYVNKKPDQELPSGVVYVGSDEVVAGRLQGEQLAKSLNGKGNVAIMLGELSSSGTRGRTQGVKEVLANYPDIKIVEEQTANFQRSEAIDLMNNWIVSGIKIDAIAANNDEMALGALLAMRQAGISPKDIVVGGVDATSDALSSMAAKELAVTVFQNAAAQGEGAVTAALSLAKGEQVDGTVWVPFELVMLDNMHQYQ